MSLPSWWGQLGSLVTMYAQEYNVDPALVAAVIQQESGGNVNATSPAGARGPMQITWGGQSAYDPAYNIQQGTSYLADQLKRFHGNTSLALAAYNAGPGAVEQYGGIPPYSETQRYVPSVLSLWQQFKDSLGGGGAAVANPVNTDPRQALEMAKVNQADQQLAGLATATPTDVVTGLGQIGQSLATGFQAEAQTQAKIAASQQAAQQGLFGGLVSWANAAFLAFERFLWIIVGIILILVGLWLLVQSQNPVARAIEAGALKGE